ncbi:hypothetical protein SUGI_0467030 [Cryptomeria japonica]|nr:hypothetical protein SUGI_0467030 [Cryptomeria japonica]
MAFESLRSILEQKFGSTSLQHKTYSKGYLAWKLFHVCTYKLAPLMYCSFHTRSSDLCPTVPLLHKATSIAGWEITLFV